MKILDLDGIVAWTTNQVKSNKGNGTDFAMLIPIVVSRFGVDAANYWPLCLKFLESGVEIDKLPFASPLVWETLQDLDTTSAASVCAFIAKAPVAYKPMLISGVSRLWRQHSWSLTEQEYRSIAPDFKTAQTLNWVTIMPYMFDPSAYKAVFTDHVNIQTAHKAHMEYSNRYQYDKSKTVKPLPAWTGLPYILAGLPIAQWPSSKSDDDIYLSVIAWDAKLSTATSLNGKEQQKLISTLSKALTKSYTVSNYGRIMDDVCTSVITKSLKLESLVTDMTKLYWAATQNPVKEAFMKNEKSGPIIYNDPRYENELNAGVPPYAFQPYMPDAHIDFLMNKYISTQSKVPSNLDTVSKFWNKNPETLKRLRPYAYSDVYFLKDKMDKAQWTRIITVFGQWLNTCEWPKVVSENVGVDVAVLDLLGDNRANRLHTLYNLTSVKEIIAAPLPDLNME